MKRTRARSVKKSAIALAVLLGAGGYWFAYRDARAPVTASFPVPKVGTIGRTAGMPQSYRGIASSTAKHGEPPKIRTESQALIPTPPQESTRAWMKKMLQESRKSRPVPVFNLVKRTREQRKEFMRAQLKLNEAEIYKYEQIQDQFKEELKSKARDSSQVSKLVTEREQSIIALLGQEKLDTLQWWESGTSERMPLQRWLESRRAIRQPAAAGVPMSLNASQKVPR